MTQGVSVIQEFTTANILQVFGNNCRLDGNGPFNQLPQHRRLRVLNRFRIGLNQVEDYRIGNETALDDFGHAGNQFVRWQGVKGVQVHQHTGWRVECAHQILAFSCVNAGFTAD